jgi:hypothetical protein
VVEAASVSADVANCHSQREEERSRSRGAACEMNVAKIALGLQEAWHQEVNFAAVARCCNTYCLEHNLSAEDGSALVRDVEVVAREALIVDSDPVCRTPVPSHDAAFRIVVL